MEYKKGDHVCMEHIMDDSHSCHSHDDESCDEMQEYMDKIQYNHSNWLEDEKYMTKLIDKLKLKLPHNIQVHKKSKYNRERIKDILQDNILQNMRLKTIDSIGEGSMFGEIGALTSL